MISFISPIEPDIAERLCKLGLHQIRDFISMPRPALKRRDRVLGNEQEHIQPV
jgi:protein ImuB